MNPTQALDESGQSIWLDDITRPLGDEGTLAPVPQPPGAANRPPAQS